ncbi:hypothetical protein [Microlunatus parietis]|uniref:Uncharacterized protein n=1 Tax=Microlunatus parietis TaxID=682979 RepID=A0A7Y9LAE6_9ACTN|nr:hypothetical protein [Microlunatus parietis]NYE72764.1 hypothetical protein [Microlunatus parietis]
MTTYEFTAVLDRPVETDADHDRLFEAGLDDTTPEGRQLRVHREADRLLDAIRTVIIDSRRAGFEVVGLDYEDLVTIETIAGRLGRTYESVRLWKAGKRGPGGFPEPVNSGGFNLYSWTAVRIWLAEHEFEVDGLPAAEDELLLAAADHLLRARSLAGDAWAALAKLAA